MAARRIAQLIPSRSKSITLDESGIRPIPYGRVRRGARHLLPSLGVALGVALTATIVCACVLWLA